MHAVFWDSEGEQGVPRERRLEKVCETFEEARAYVAEQAELGYGHYMRMLRVESEADAKSLEFGPNEDVTSQREDGQDRSDYETEQGYSPIPGR